MTHTPTIAAPRELSGRPRLRPAAGAWDCHCHVFGPHHRFPYASERSYTPHDIPVEKLMSLHRELGFDHAVLVQPAAHGLDHSAMLDALGKSGGRYRGVMLVGDDGAALDVESLHRQGVRAVRYNLIPHLGSAPDMAIARALAARLKDAGWHICLHSGADQVDQLEAWLDFDVPIVLDHMGRLDPASPNFGRDTGTLLELLQHPQFHIKLSGVDRMSRPSPPYEDGAVLARRLFDTAPGKCLWGTDYPHPNHRSVPEDVDLVDLIARIAPTAADQAVLLVENPRQLYR